jgi:antitoxin component YwqK of YwqJK toxin-antitoxin module
MGMDFMEQRAPFQIKSLMMLVLATMVLVACQKTPGKLASSHTLQSVEFKNGSFKTNKGMTYDSGTLFTGILLRKYENGQALQVDTIVEGLVQGLSKAWYQNGERMWERLYLNGKKEGKHRRWYRGGAPKSEGNYSEDFYQGNLREWYPNGQMYKDFNYVDGQEDGHQKMWKSDGRVKANYVVRNGRRYGLTGVKNCINVFEK